MPGKLLLFLVASLLLPSCELVRGNRMEVTNRSKATLTDVRVAFADAEFERASLGPGETFMVSPSPRRDGGISLSYGLGGERVRHNLGYVAPPLSMTCRFTIDGRDVAGDCRQN